MLNCSCNFDSLSHFRNVAFKLMPIIHLKECMIRERYMNMASKPCPRCKTASFPQNVTLETWSRGGLYPWNSHNKADTVRVSAYYSENFDNKVLRASTVAAFSESRTLVAPGWDLRWWDPFLGREQFLEDRDYWSSSEPWISCHWQQ